MELKSCGQNVVIGENFRYGSNVSIGHNCIIEKDVDLGDNVFVDSNTIIRSGTSIGNNTFIGSNCIIGEYQMDFCMDKKHHDHLLTIGRDSVLRSGTIIYTGSEIGNNFQTGHRVTIRENSKIGNFVSFGTLSDIQGNCEIGDYVRAHSNVHIAQQAKIDNFVWMFPYVVFTNDSTPPSEELAGVHVCSFAIIASDSLLLPGRTIGQDALVGAGSVVTKDVKPYCVVSGNPARTVSDVRRFNKIIGKEIYPWRESFKRTMPWNEKGWSEWYSSLDDETKKYFKLESLDL